MLSFYAMQWTVMIPFSSFDAISFIAVTGAGIIYSK